MCYAGKCKQHPNLIALAIVQHTPADLYRTTGCLSTLSGYQAAAQPLSSLRRCAGRVRSSKAAAARGLVGGDKTPQVSCCGLQQSYVLIYSAHDDAPRPLEHSLQHLVQLLWRCGMLCCAGGLPSSCFCKQLRHSHALLHTPGMVEHCPSGYCSAQVYVALRMEGRSPVIWIHHRARLLWSKHK
jgi:hypothetical protein